MNFLLFVHTTSCSTLTLLITHTLGNLSPTISSDSRQIHLQHEQKTLPPYPDHGENRKKRCPRDPTITRLTRGENSPHKKILSYDPGGSNSTPDQIPHTRVPYQSTIEDKNVTFVLNHTSDVLNHKSRNIQGKYPSFQIVADSTPDLQQIQIKEICSKMCLNHLFLVPTIRCVVSCYPL